MTTKAGAEGDRDALSPGRERAYVQGVPSLWAAFRQSRKPEEFRGFLLLRSLCGRLENTAGFARASAEGTGGGGRVASIRSSCSCLQILRAAHEDQRTDAQGMDPLCALLPVAPRSIGQRLGGVGLYFLRLEHISTDAWRC